MRAGENLLMSDDYELATEYLNILQETEEHQRRRLWLSEPPIREYERISMDALWIINPRYRHFSARAAIGSTVRIEGTLYLIAGLDQEAEQYLLVPTRSVWRTDMLEPYAAAQRMNDFAARVHEMFRLAERNPQPLDNSPSLSRGLTGREPMLSQKVANDDSE